MRLSDSLGPPRMYVTLAALEEHDSMIIRFIDVATQVHSRFNMEPPDHPYTHWQFFRVPDGRWLARTDVPKKVWPYAQCAYVEWAGGRWQRDEDRLYAVHHDLMFLGSGLRDV